MLFLYYQNLHDSYIPAQKKCVIREVKEGG